MKNLLYSDFYNSEYFDSIKKDIAEWNQVSIDEVTETEVTDLISNIQQNDWDQFCTLVRLQSETAYILAGTISSNYPEYYGYGSRTGCKYTDDLINTLIQLGDNLEISETDGHYFVRFAHHDGGGTVEIIALSSKGAEYYDQWNLGETDDEKTEYQVLETIMQDPELSHVPFTCNQ